MSSSVPPASSTICARASASKEILNLTDFTPSAARNGRTFVLADCVSDQNQRTFCASNMSIHRYLVALITGILLAALPLASADEPLKAGAKIELLPAGKITYHDVVVRSINVRALMITHAGGMASIRLRDLSPEWQARFNYDPAAEAAADEAAKNAPPPPPVVHHTRVAPKGISKFDALLQKFGQPAAVLPEVDLRPKFFQLELGVKNQGYRPSCAVFAIVSALEFQNAELSGKVEKFSGGISDLGGAQIRATHARSRGHGPDRVRWRRISRRRIFPG